MTDPIERVARVVAPIVLPHRAVCLPSAFDTATGQRKRMFLDIGRATIEEYNAWLTEQGIPVEKLLSGKMKAVPAGFLEAAVPINNAERLVVEYAVMKCGHETVELTAAVMNLREMRKQAQLDYAGNPPVTPDLAQTDLQKKG